MLKLVGMFIMTIMVTAATMINLGTCEQLYAPGFYVDKILIALLIALNLMLYVFYTILIGYLKDLEAK